MDIHQIIIIHHNVKKIVIKDGILMINKNIFVLKI